jgi:hypothetical protein
MNPFPDDLHFDNAGMHHGKRAIVITRPFECVSSLGRIVVHRGFVCDGASIPKCAHSIVGHPFDEYLEDCVVHDWLYSPFNDNFYRDEADLILKETMWNRSIHWFKREAIYRAVRLFGGRSFKALIPTI